MAVVALAGGCSDDQSASRTTETLRIESSGEETTPAGGAAGDAGAVDQLDPAYLEGRSAIVVEGEFGKPMDFREVARSKSFRGAIRDFEREAGATRVAVQGILGAAGFRVEHAVAERALLRWNSEYGKRGVFVFRFEDTHGYGGGDAIMLLPTRNKYTVLRAVGTNGVNLDIYNAQVIRWLKTLERTHPFRLTEAGADYLAGRFATPVRDADALARRMYRFCPDIVDQGTGTVPALARELQRTQELYLWWD